jgi:hypothetical protein
MDMDRAKDDRICRDCHSWHTGGDRAERQTGQIDIVYTIGRFSSSPDARANMISVWPNSFGEALVGANNQPLTLDY